MSRIARQLVRPVYALVKHRYAERQIAMERKREEEIVLKNFHGIPFNPLTREEKEAILGIWTPLLGGRGMSFNELELFKTYRGFDPRYLSHNVYLPLLAHKINDYRYTKLFEHKSLLGKLAGVAMKYPRCFMRSIDSEYYDNELKQLSKEEVVRSCCEQSVLIVKDSTDSSGGQGVEKVTLDNLSMDERVAKVSSILESRKRDFVIQECVEQNVDMARFNPSSINTFRITTLYLNGVFSVLSIILRFGKQGMTVDNWGSGGILVGVGNDGQLYDKGYDINLNEFEEYNGVYFSHTRLKQIPSILKAVEYEHTTNFSLCKLIGWDICIDSRNEAVVIEVNASQPGVIGEQLCTGPIFGDRTLEVVDYCAHKKLVYNHIVFPC